MKNLDENQALTIGMFDAFLRERFDPTMARIDRRLEELDRKMMDGFSMLDRKIDLVEENLSAKIDILMTTKADKEDLMAVHRRVTNLERKIA